MNCPDCKQANAYVGLNIVECGNSACMHFKASMQPVEAKKNPNRHPAKWASFNATWSSGGYHPQFDGRFRRRVSITGKKSKKMAQVEFYKYLQKIIAKDLKKKVTKSDYNPMADHGDFYFGD